MPAETLKIPVQIAVWLEWDTEDGTVEYSATDPLGNRYHGYARQESTSWKVALWLNNNPIPHALRTVSHDEKRAKRPDHDRVMRVIREEIGKAAKARALSRPRRPHRDVRLGVDSRGRI